MFRTRKALNLLLATSVLAWPAAWAQEGTDAESRQQTVVVTGTPIRDSQVAAIETKRNAENVVDIIAADTIGRFPDQNLADSLGRLPGLAIERDQGQARYINFRGLPFRNTKIAFDGMDIPGAENGRTTRFDAFPSVITAAVEANKAITPDMPGEAVAGFVNIRTYSPFDQEGFHVSAEAGYGEQELGGGPVKKYNGRASWSNDTLGLVVFGSHNARVQNTDNREYSLSLNETNGELTLNSVDFRSYFVEREDSAYGGTIEVRPQSDTVDRLFFSTLNSEFIDTEQRNQYTFATQDAPEGSEANGVVALVTRALEYGQYDNSTFTNTLGADFALSGWDMEARYNYTKTEDNLYLPLPYSVYGVAGVNYNISNLEDPILTLVQPGTSTPMALSDINYATTLGLFYTGAFDIDSNKLKLDASRDTDLFGDTVVKLGVQYDTRKGKGFVPTASYIAAPSNIGSYETDTLWYSDFTNSINGHYYRNEQLRADWAAEIGGFPDVTAPEDQATKIEEKILALYAMGTTTFGRGSLTYGARMESTDYTSDGFTVTSGVSSPNSYSDDYVNVLPSVHFNYDLTDELKFRASMSTGVSRPNYTEMRSSVGVNPLATPRPLASGGNPRLDPEESIGGDLSLEWYHGDASLLSVGAFYRSIDNVIYAQTGEIEANLIDPAQAAGVVWDYKSFFNGSDGRANGFEVNAVVDLADFLPVESLSGVGFNFNATLLDSEFKTREGVKYSLPGTSDAIYNASIYVEKWGLSARLNYQYRDDWMSTTENDGLDEYWAAETRVDASLRYTLPFETRGAQFTVFLNGNNLTNETDVRYTDTPRTPNQVEGYGRYWLMGLRADF
nr:TonB-dependent receptor [uncultured Hyphomonas sp.]